MRLSSLLVLVMSFCTQAADGELWLVELEHNDGIRLQFQGAELELGSARLIGVRHVDELKPGMGLAILSRNGVAEQIRLHSGMTGFDTAGYWHRADVTLQAVSGNALHLKGLGSITFDVDTRWCNGGPADLQPGRELALTRDDGGRLIEILIVNPEEDLDGESEGG